MLGVEVSGGRSHDFMVLGGWCIPCTLHGTTTLQHMPKPNVPEWPRMRNITMRQLRGAITPNSEGLCRYYSNFRFIIQIKVGTLIERSLFGLSKMS